MTLTLMIILQLSLYKISHKLLPCLPKYFILLVFLFCGGISSFSCLLDLCFQSFQDATTLGDKYTYLGN